MIPKNPSRSATLIITSVLLQCVNCVQVMLGDCPIYYDEPCNPETVTFYLLSRPENITIYYQLDPLNLILPDVFDPRKPLKITVHGYGGLNIDVAIKNVSRAYLDRGDNVILVDWSNLASVPCYPGAYLNTWHVGQCLAILAVSLIPMGVSPSNIHLIGFSLGAHIAGFAGTHMKKIVKKPLQRITGLDPALPLFATLFDDWKLDPSDAKFVDVIHTSAGTFGKLEAVGHADFYVNGGLLQPACYDAPYPPLCSHIMSGIYFAETIRNNQSFIGIECENIGNYFLGLCRNRRKARMGENVNHRTKGVFFVEAAATRPTLV